MCNSGRLFIGIRRVASTITFGVEGNGSSFTFNGSLKGGSFSMRASRSLMRKLILTLFFF